MELYYRNANGRLFMDGLPIARFKEIHVGKDAMTIARCFGEEMFEYNWIYDPIQPDGTDHKRRVIGAVSALNGEIMHPSITFEYCEQTERIMMREDPTDDIEN
jgi:hypothetical protein